MAFDPDAYLAKKAAFDPDAYLKAKGAAAPSGPGVGEAALRSVGQGFTSGFGDELAAGVDALDQKLNGLKGRALRALGLPVPDWADNPDRGKSFTDLYRESRDANRRDNKAAQDAHPYVSLAGNVVGGIPAAIATGGGNTQGLSAGAKLLRAVATGVGFGAVGAAGDSTAEDASGIAKDALTGAGVGGGLSLAIPAAGKAASVLLPKAAQALDQLSVAAGRKVLSNVTNSLSKAKPVSDEAVREAQASGAFRLFGTSKGAAARLEATRAQVGDQYGRIVDALRAKGITGSDAEALAQKYLAEGASTAATSMQPAVPGVFEQAADQIAKKPTVGGRFDLRQQEGLKRSLQDAADAAYKQLDPNELAQAKTRAASMMRQAVEDEITTQAAASADPETQALAAQFKPLKQRLGPLIEASNTADAGMARQQKRQPFGLMELLGLAAGSHAGGPAGLATAVGVHLAKTRGPSTAAVLSRAGADAIDNLTSPRLAQLLELLARPATPLLAEQAGEGVAQ